MTERPSLVTLTTGQVDSRGDPPVAPENVKRPAATSSVRSIRALNAEYRAASAASAASTSVRSSKEAHYQSRT